MSRVKEELPKERTRMVLCARKNKYKVPEVVNGWGKGRTTDGSISLENIPPVCQGVLKAYFAQKDDD